MDQNETHRGTLSNARADAITLGVSGGDGMASAGLLAEMFESTSAGLAVLRGPDLIVESANRACEVLAPPEPPLVGRSAAKAWPVLARRVVPIARRVLETGKSRDVRDVRLLVSAVGEAPRRRYFTFRLSPLAAAGDEPRLWLAFMDTTPQVSARQRAGLLTSFSTDLSRHLELSWVVRRTLRRAVALLGGEHGALWLLEPDGFTLRAAYGSPIREVRHEAFDLRALPTCQRALETHSAAFFTKRDLAGAEAALFERVGVNAGLVAPLAAGARHLGLLTMSFGMRDARPDEEELAFASALASQSALALERVRAMEQARWARLVADAAQARFRLLADVGKILSATLDWEGAVHAATRLALGRLADWALLDVVDYAGALRRESVGAAPPWALGRDWAPVGEVVDRGDPAVEEAIRTKQTRAWDLGTGAVGALASPYLASLRAAGAGSAVVAPLAARAEVFGVLSLARAAGVRPYDRDDVALAQELATRLAVALHNARLLRSAESALEAHHGFMAMARHELRTPLTALNLHLRLLTRASQDEDKRTRRHLDAIQHSVDRLQRAVEQLFDIAHIGDGALALDREPLDLVPLTREVVARVAPELARVGCTVNVVAPERLAANGDRLRVRGILHHLLDHAARLGPRKPIDVVLSQHHGRPAMEVRYRGPSLPAEVREHLVGPLDRSAPRMTFADVGLGLWIARWILHAHGGRLLIHTWLEGAAFIAELPAEDSEDNAV